MPKKHIDWEAEVEYEVPDPHGPWPGSTRKVREVLTLQEVIKKWTYQRKVSLNILINKVQAAYKCTREPAYRRIREIVEKEPSLSFVSKGRYKFVWYNPHLDKPMEDTTTTETKTLTTIEPEEESPIDIWAMLVEAERKRIIADLEKRDS